MGNAHEIVAARHGQKRCQILNIILVCLHVVGIAAVAAHGDPRELAHEVVFQTGSGHLPGIIQIFRPDEPYHCVHQEGRKPLGKAVAR